ncbi:MAG: DUF5711 family protein, partial [Hungatella sp.]
MANNGPINDREMKKRQLQSRMISNPELRNEQKKDSDKIVKTIHKKILKKRLTVILILLILVGAALFGIYEYQRHYQYTGYTVGWEKHLDRGESSFTGYMNFGSNLLKYTKDGAAYVDADGKDVWIQSYEMKSPIAAVSGDYAAIADQQGNSIYICDKTGNQGVATTLLPILKVSISDKGVVAAVLEDQKANYITLFRKDGTPLDITIKGLLEGEVGYPLDIALSPDGTQLMGSYVYIGNGALKNRVAFHNFSEVGKNIPNRLVGGYDDPYEGSMVARVVFLDETYSCAFADHSLSFFSSKNVMSPELLVQIPVEEEIRSIFHSPDYVGIIVSAAAGEFDYRMDLYEKDGTKVFSQEFSYDYLKADIDGDNILLYNEDSCRVYSMWGTLKFEGTFDFVVSKITSGTFFN